MRPINWLSLGALAAALSLAHAADPSNDPYGLWKPFRSAIYKIHSGVVADRSPPTAKDRMLTILVDGPIAKDIFDSIAPDLLDKCSSESGDRERAKKGIMCTYTIQLDSPKDSHYRCWIGLDLRTGNSVKTVSC
ncbi:hypothetical protein [Massilia sp. erpn]|uniref:hypothetical protein n=1 Tax=Massilia sp. erpn TaxID=2738142 RepID=UPI0021049FC7|nr:hypothetical protein [Massilia sp. erpn]UTY57993.1 hypothetical protein HPQ68_12855 [Massilia sp. erpn]